MTHYPEYGSTEWKLFQYNAAKEAKRGHNYAYYSDELGEKLKVSGYQWHEFTRNCNMDGTKVVNDYTSSEIAAKEVVEQYRKDGYYARIICGKEMVVQRIKYFSVAYKKKDV